MKGNKGAAGWVAGVQTDWTLEANGWCQDEEVEQHAQRGQQKSVHIFLRLFQDLHHSGSYFPKDAEVDWLCLKRGFAPSLPPVSLHYKWPEWTQKISGLNKWLCLHTLRLNRQNFSMKKMRNYKKCTTRWMENHWTCLNNSWHIHESILLINPLTFTPGDNLD